MSSQVGSAAADTEQCDTPMELANTPPQLGLLADSDDTYSSPSPLSTLHVEDDISDITAPDYSPVVSIALFTRHNPDSLDCIRIKLCLHSV